MCRGQPPGAVLFNACVHDPGRHDPHYEVRHRGSAAQAVIVRQRAAMLLRQLTLGAEAAPVHTAALSRRRAHAAGRTQWLRI